MSIKDDLIKYFSQYLGDTGGFGVNANPQSRLNVDSVLSELGQQTGNFGKINPQIPIMGNSGFNQLNTATNAMVNPINAQTALNSLVDAKDPAKKAGADMAKQLIAKSMGSMGGSKQQMQPDLKIINAQQAFAQMPDATQPVQEFQPQQMAMMLRKRYGSV